LITYKNSFSRRLKPAKDGNLTTKDPKENIRKQPKAVWFNTIPFYKENILLSLLRFSIYDFDSLK
jgi:hypothetical protein